MCENMRFFLTKDTVKEVTKKFTSDSHASGDGVYRRFCRLCSGQHGLTSFSGSERYDQLLYNCFGISVTPSDSVICELCVRQLTLTERFKEMVETALEEKALSDSSSRTCILRIEPVTLTIKPPMITVSESKDKIVQKPKPKLKKVVKEKKPRNTPGLAKKSNIACSICKQRYPVMLPASARPADFVCARCKNNDHSAMLRKCNLPSTVMLDRLREHGKKLARLNEGTSLKPRIKKCDSATKYHREPRKYNCSQCTLKFLLPQSLADHINSVHSVGLDSSCIVCGKNLKTRAQLKSHLKVHTGELNQCDVCLKIFKSKPILKTHMMGHRKSLPASKLVGASTVSQMQKN